MKETIRKKLKTEDLIPNDLLMGYELDITIDVPPVSKLQGNKPPQRYTGWPDYSLHTDIADAAAQLKPFESKKRPKFKKKK